MANPPKLPFVWELSLDGVVSHAVGTIHSSPYDVKQECADLLSGKSHLLVEYDIRRGVDLTKINALSVPGNYNQK
ncbi:MAG TPA: hypothetical protein VJI32_04695 [Candidatus Nanoarchaeia archaeon]|nr:hypothetical protein [Candidatus Nanoarchaeia archaeon]